MLLNICKTLICLCCIIISCKPQVLLSVSNDYSEKSDNQMQVLYISQFVFSVEDMFP